MRCTCRVLGRMCATWPEGARLTVDKISKHLPGRLTPPVITALAYTGSDALDAVFWPHLRHVLDDSPDMIAAVTQAASLLYKQENCDRTSIEARKTLAEEFGDALIPLYSHTGTQLAAREDVAGSYDWIQLKRQLLNTRHVHCCQDTTLRTSRYHLAFKRRPVVPRSPIIRIAGFRSLPIKQRIRPDQLLHVSTNANASVQVGRTTLLTLKKQYLTDKRCYADPLLYNL